jgi:hypothetical protein
MPATKRGAMGSGGSCICLKCGHREPHRAGKPCRDRKCPTCKAVLVRENSEHHRAFLEKQKAKKEKGGD